MSTELHVLFTAAIRTLVHNWVTYALASEDNPVTRLTVRFFYKGPQNMRLSIGVGNYAGYYQFQLSKCYVFNMRSCAECNIYNKAYLSCF